MTIMEVIAVAGVTLAIGEYYNRFRIDKIRREQLEDMRGRRRHAARNWDEELLEEFDTLERPRRRNIINAEQYEEMRRTGRTGGKLKGGA